MDAKIQMILTETEKIRTNLNNMLTEIMYLYGVDYTSVTNEEKMLLGVVINNTKALSAMFVKTIGEE